MDMEDRLQKKCGDLSLIYSGRHERGFWAIDTRIPGFRRMLRNNVKRSRLVKRNGNV